MNSGLDGNVLGSKCAHYAVYVFRVPSNEMYGKGFIIHVALSNQTKFKYIAKLMMQFYADITHHVDEFYLLLRADCMFVCFAP